MPRSLGFLAGYAEPDGTPLDVEEAAAINERMDEENDETWTEVDSWYIYNVAVGVFTDGVRHIVMRRVDRPAPGAREHYGEQIAPYRAALDKVGYEQHEPRPWELDTEIDQLTGLSGYADEKAALQDGLRLTLGAIIVHENDDTVFDWCGWRDDVVILARSEASSVILRVHSADRSITVDGSEDILRAYNSYAEAVQKLIDYLDYNLDAFEGVSFLARRMVQAWLARSAANAMLERARHVLRTAADGVQFIKDDEKSGLVGTLAAGLHTDRPNLYRIIPQMKEITASGRIARLRG